MVNNMVEVIVGLMILLAVLLLFKILFWAFVVVLLSPIIFVGAIFLSVGVMVLTVIAVVFLGLLKLLLLPFLLLLMIPFALFS